jgi:1-phosphofructokinase family hexose kinase
MQARLAEQFAETGISLDLTESAAPTRSCITVLETGGQATELVEEALPLRNDEAEAFLASALSACASSGVVLLAGSLPPGLPPDTYARCTRVAHASGAIVVIDAQGPPLRLALDEKADVVKINREELARTLGDRVGRGETEAAAFRLQQMGARQVVITDGAGDVLLCNADGSCVNLTPPALSPVNPIGSGDATSGALALALLRGESAETAFCYAIAAGSANVTSMIPGEVDARQVDVLFRQLLDQIDPGAARQRPQNG